MSNDPGTISGNQAQSQQAPVDHGRLLRRLERIYHAGMAGQDDPAEATIKGLRGEIAAMLKELQEARLRSSRATAALNGEPPGGRVHPERASDYPQDSFIYGMLRNWELCHMVELSTESRRELIQRIREIATRVPFSRMTDAQPEECNQTPQADPLRGPAGPAGPQVPPGRTGATGATGPAAEPGHMNDPLYLAAIELVKEVQAADHWLRRTNAFERLAKLVK
jgi:hypothetical protein